MNMGENGTKEIVGQLFFGSLVAAALRKLMFDSEHQGSGLMKRCVVRRKDGLPKGVC